MKPSINARRRQVILGVFSILVLLATTLLVVAPALAESGYTMDFKDVVIGETSIEYANYRMPDKLFEGPCPRNSKLERRHCGFRISFEPPDAARICGAPTQGPFALPYGCAWNLRPDEKQNFAVSCTPSSTETYTAWLYAYVVRNEKVESRWHYPLVCKGVPPPSAGAVTLPAALLLFMD